MLYAFNQYDNNRPIHFRVNHAVYSDNKNITPTKQNNNIKITKNNDENTNYEFAYIIQMMAHDAVNQHHTKFVTY